MMVLLALSQATEGAVTETADEHQPTGVSGDAPIINSESTVVGGSQEANGEGSPETADTDVHASEQTSSPDEDQQSQLPIQDGSGEGNHEDGRDQTDSNGGDIVQQDSGQGEPASQSQPAGIYCNCQCHI